MTPYHKTYRGFHTKELQQKKRLKFIKLILVLLLDSIFAVLLSIFKVIKLSATSAAPVTGRILYALFLKITLPFYRLVLVFHRKQKNILRGRNPLFFLVSNRYVSHSIVLLIVLITIIHNLQIRGLRAEEFGKTALFGKLSKGETFTTDYFEEEIVASSKPQKNRQLRPGALQNPTKTKLTKQRFRKKAPQSSSQTLPKPLTRRGQEKA
jgi:hypothetical protein